MRLIIHYPDTAEKEKELEKQVSAFHAKAVIDFIQNLPCPQEEKKELIEEIIKNAGKP